MALGWDQLAADWTFFARRLYENKNDRLRHNNLVVLLYDFHPVRKCVGAIGKKLAEATTNSGPDSAS
jgi:hypothetical protein